MLDTAGPSQLQWPTEGTAEPSAMLVPQGKSVWEKAKPCMAVKSDGKRPEKEPCEDQSQGRRKSWSSFPHSCGEELSTVQPMEDPQRSRWIFTEGNWRPRRAHAGVGSSWRTAAHGKDPHWSGGSARGKEQRRAVMDWLQIPVPHPLCIAQHGEEVEELRKKQWNTLAWDKKGGGGKVFNFCLYFLTPPIHWQ